MDDDDTEPPRATQKVTRDRGPVIRLDQPDRAPDQRLSSARKHGVAVVSQRDGTHRVLYANAAFADVLCDRDSAPDRDDDSRLSHIDAQVDALIRAVDPDDDGDAVVVLPRAGKRPLLVRLRATPVGAFGTTEDATLLELEPLAAIESDVESPLQEREAIDDPLARLSARQRSIAEMIASQGQTVKEIAFKLELSVHTVRNHVRAIYQKLGVHSQGEFFRAMNRR